MFKHISQTRLTQLAIAAGFLSFGVAWVAAPESMVKLFAATDLPIVPLALIALGAQALAAGIFALIARFKSWTFVGFGVSLLPIFAADYWLYAKSGAFNEMILVHATGMALILVLCAQGFFITQRQERAAEYAR